MLDFLKKNKKEKEAQVAREAAMEAERQRKEEEKRKLAEQRAKIDEHAKAAKGFSVHWTILILKILKCWQNKRKAESVLKRSETMQR